MRNLRQTDTELKTKIEALIEKEPDTTERARLLILLQISNLLVDNIDAQRRTSIEVAGYAAAFKTHVEEQDQLINRGWGMWKVAGGVLFVMQLLIGGIIGVSVSQVDSNGKDIKVLQQKVSTVEVKVDAYSKSYLPKP